MQLHPSKNSTRLPGAATCLADELLDQFFNAPTQRSFKECYIQITGDKRVTGQLKDCSRARMVESFGAAFRESLDSNALANALGAAVARRMVGEYRDNDGYSAWRKLVTVSNNIPDFRSQYRTRFGGYGELPTVAEGAAYMALPSPTDESASFAIQKRGGTEAITTEMIRNDNIGAIRLLPKRLADAAQRTLAHFVLDMLRANPTIYDGLPVFHASHNNLGASVLSASALAAAVASMKKQTEMGTGDQLGLQPRFLFVPLELEETGFNLFRRGTNQDRTFVQNLNVELVPIWYWTDANDWCVSTDPADAPTIEVGFLGESEEPEIVLQDMPSAGSLFSSDQLTFKIRHMYGGTVIDYRGIFKSVVP